MTVDAARVRELASLLDTAAARAQFDVSIISELLTDQDPADAGLQQLANAFRHPLARKEGAARVGPMPMFVEDEVAYRALADAPEEECKLWAAVAELCVEPMVLAWLHDVLFERRWKPVGEHRRQAFEANIRVAEADVRSGPGMRAADALRRANELANLGRAAAEIELVRSMVLTAASSSLKAQESRPGVDLRLLELVIDADHLTEVDYLLALARQTYPSAHNLQHVIKLQMKRTRDPGRRESLERDLVQVWVDEARSADPFVRILHLETAAKIARDRGLPDLVDAVVVEMQQTEKPEIPMIRVEVPTTVTSEQIESLIEDLIGNTFAESVARVLAYGPPTGNWDRNQALAREMAEEHPLSALFPVVRMGVDGLPRHSPGADGRDDGVAEVERLALSHFGSVLAEALRRAVERHGPSEQEVADGLTADGCSAALAARIARSLRRFAAGDYEGCAYTALPLIECLARDLLLSVGAPLYRVQTGETRGQYDGLGAMIEALSDRGLDPSWYRFLRFLLTAPDGQNLRNEALHGFVDDIGEVGAAWVLMAVFYLTCLGPARDATIPAA